MQLSATFDRFVSRFPKTAVLPKRSGTSANPGSIRLSRKRKIFFLDTLASLVGAGIPLVKSLQLLYFQSDVPAIRTLASYVKTEVERGQSLASVARGLPRIFSGFDAAMFEMGDATGKIADILRTLNEKEEKSLALERKISGALVYPAAVVTVAMAMLVVLMVYVVPRIEGIYSDAHTNLPALTLSVIAVSHFLRDFGAFVLAGLVAVGFGIRFALNVPRIRYAFDRSILRIPVLGGLVKGKILVIFADFLAILLASGITIHKALDIVATALGNAYYDREVQGVIADVRSGKSLSLAIGGDYLEKKMAGVAIDPATAAESARRLDCFTMELSTAVKVGEQTGSLAAMLRKAAERYDREIDTTVKSLSSLLEPVVIVVIGAIVGVIVLAIMMPFFNMVQVVQ